MDHDVNMSNFHLWRYIHQFKSCLKLNETVPLFLEACCSVAWFLILSLELVETAPNMWARPLEARLSYGLSILCSFLVISMVGLFRKPWASLYTHISLLAKELRPGFVALFGIPVAFCFGTVLFLVILNLLMCYAWHYLSCFFLTKSNKSVSIIHWNCSALLEVCFSFLMFLAVWRGSMVSLAPFNSSPV